VFRAAGAPTPDEVLGADKVAQLMVEQEAELKAKHQELQAKTVELPPVEKKEPEAAVAKDPYCPVCGADLTTNRPPVIDESDRDSWVRHLFGEERFRKSYLRVNGTVRIILRSRLASETDEIYRQIAADVADGTLSSAPGFMLGSPNLSRMNRLVLAMSLERVEKADGTPILVMPVVSTEAYPPVDDKDKNQPVARAYAKLINKLGDNALAVLMSCLRDFEKITMSLTFESSQASFFSGPDAAG